MSDVTALMFVPVETPAACCQTSHGVAVLSLTLFAVKMKCIAVQVEVNAPVGTVVLMLVCNIHQTAYLWSLPYAVKSACNANTGFVPLLSYMTSANLYAVLIGSNNSIEMLCLPHVSESRSKKAKYGTL